MTAVRVGTSGWSYKNWHGQFYPPEVSRKRELAYLATKFDTVEINGTFYSLTKPAHCDAWRAQVPSTFVFAIKGSRYITHMLKLQNVTVAMANFLSSGILRLGRHLGPILWQLPAMVHFDAAKAASFFEQLPRNMRDAERLAGQHDERTSDRAATEAPDGRRLKLRHALEVRHDSWLSKEALSLLAKHNIALVAADTAGKFPFSLERTADFAYVRLHGSTELYTSGYTAEEIQVWAKQIRRWSRTDDVYVYFDNDAKVFAPKDAAALITALEC